MQKTQVYCDVCEEEIGDTNLHERIIDDWFLVKVNLSVFARTGELELDVCDNCKELLARAYFDKPKVEEKC